MNKFLKEYWWIIAIAIFIFLIYKRYELNEQKKKAFPNMNEGNK